MAVEAGGAAGDPLKLPAPPAIDWDDDAAWESQLRAALIDVVPGPCVLDVSEDLIRGFGSGYWGYVEQDLRSAFVPEVSESIEAAVRGEVQDCLAVRRELVNYKKLCLHLWQGGLVVESDLRQLTTFFYCGVLGDEAEPARKERYTELAVAMNGCSGVVKALFDARYFGKMICGLPRHPDTGAPKKLEELPSPAGLEIWKPLQQAQHFLDTYDQVDAYWASRFHRKQGEQLEAPPDALPVDCAEVASESQEQSASADGAVPKKPVKEKMMWSSERQRVASVLSTGALKEIMAMLVTAGVHLPAAALRYVELVFVARGATKALAIRTALRRYCAGLRGECQRMEQIIKDLELVKTTKSGDAAAGLHLQAEKHVRILSAIASVVPAMLKWLDSIADSKHGAQRLFVSGSRGAAAFVPRGFEDALGPYRKVVQAHRGSMLAEIAEVGWPKSAQPRPEDKVHLKPCTVCEKPFTKFWMHRGVCFSCEERLRADGRCPFSKRCGAASFCPHDRKCVVCEQHSCEECGLLRGDGEDVWQLVGQRQPAAVFLDFDRTLCTTKAGGSPLEGEHAIDPDLAAVCSGHPNVVVVTRSSRKGDIEQFLSQRGVPVRRVCCLRHAALPNKAAAISEELAALPEASTAIFVDDDIRELTQPGLAPLVEGGKLLRVLFARAGGKE